MRCKILAAVMTLGSMTALAQRAFVQLDTSRENRCARNNEGNLWVVRDMSPRNNAHPEVYTLTVQVLPLGTVAAYEVARFLTPGGSAELGCSLGASGANYQFLNER